MALRRQVVNLIGGQPVNHVHHPFGARQVSVVEKQPRVRIVGVLIDVVDALRVDRARSPYDSVNLVSLGKQKLGHVGAVLSGNSGDQCPSHQLCSSLPESVCTAPNAYEPASATACRASPIKQAAFHSSRNTAPSLR